MAGDQIDVKYKDVDKVLIKLPEFVNNSIDNPKSDVDKNTKKSIHDVDTDELHLSIYELAELANVHFNTIKKYCLAQDPDQTKIIWDGNKKLIELRYALDRLYTYKVIPSIQDVDTLYTKYKTKMDLAKVKSSQHGVDNHVDTALVDSLYQQIHTLQEQVAGLGALLAQRTEEVINTRNDYKRQLAIKDDQIERLLKEMSEARNQANTLLGISMKMDKILKLEEKKKKWWFGFLK